jgi:hypothetical protein
MLTPTSSGLLPFSKQNYWRGSRTGIEIDSEDLQTIVEKWVRGILYCETGNIIPLEDVVQFHFFEESAAAELRSSLQSENRFRLGPYVEVDLVYGGLAGSMFRFRFWKFFEVYANLIPKSPLIPAEI